MLESLFNAVASLKTATALKITPAQVFSWEFYEIFKNSRHIADDISSFLASTFSAFIALTFLKMISRTTILNNQMEDFCF